MTAAVAESLELLEAPPTTHINQDLVNRETTRWMAYCGDTILPSQKSDQPSLILGGEYFGQQYLTLSRTKGLVRRCQLTPMEMAFEYDNPERFGMDAPATIVTGQSSLIPIKLYPGDQLSGIMNGERNGVGKGFIELEGLRGLSPEEVGASGLQTFLFPNWQNILLGTEKLPFTINGLEKHLDERMGSTFDSSIKNLIGSFLESCNKYRRWGTAYLKTNATLVRTPAHQGHVFTYSELSEELFKQLEIERNEIGSDGIGAAPQYNSTSPEVLAILAKLADLATATSAVKQTDVEMPSIIIQTPTATIDLTETATAVPMCGHTKDNGDQCGAKPMSNGMCRHHGGDNGGDNGEMNGNGE